MRKKTPKKGEPGYREYNKQKTYARVIKKIKEDQADGGPGDIVNASDLIVHSGVSSSTFYDYFPAGSEELENIKDMLEVTRIKIKSGVRKKLYKGGQALGLIALYKLLGTDEERAILNQQEVRLSGSVNASVTSKQTVVFKTREKKSE